MAAEPIAGAIPCLIARMKPVPAPLNMEFQGSSFCRRATNEQSHSENVSPHTPKLPAVRGVFILALAIAPSNLLDIPFGAFLAPPTMETKPPPKNPSV
uniref:Uncharacterized protein n=1 Tax=Ciona intestinalis TaxID=7719 RepID=H2XLB6_CIOIN